LQLWLHKNKNKLALEKKEKETKREVFMKSLEEEGLSPFFYKKKNNNKIIK